MERLLRYRGHADDKRLVWEHLTPDRVWQTTLGGAHLSDLPLYQRDLLKPGIGAGEPIVVVESETSVDALVKAGIYATTWAGGARNPNVERLFEMLAGSDVVLIPDNDPSGLDCAEKILEHFDRQGAPISVIVTPVSGQDARDLLRELGSRAFARMIST